MRFYVKLFFTTCILIVVGLLSLSSPNLSTNPRVDKGVLDLSDWDFERDGIVELRGQWGFTEGITNEPVQSELDKQFADVPGAMPITENRGAGTYHLKVILPSNAETSLGLEVNGVRMSNALYVNGQLVHSEGQPANERADYIARNIPYVSQFTADGDELTIRFEVANFDYYKSGIHLPIYLGTSDQISKQQKVHLIFEVSILMMTIVVAFIFLVVYFSFDKDKGGLILGSYFLVLAILIATTNQKVLLQIFPDLPFILFVQIRDFAMYFSIPLLIYYAMNLFPKSKKGWMLLRIIAAIYFVYSLAIIIVPYKILGGVGDAILLPLLLATYLLIPFSMLRKYHHEEASVVNKKELEYFILLIIAEAGIIFASVLYYAKTINHLWLLMVSGIFASLFTILMFIEKFKKTYVSMEDYAAKLEREISLKDEFLSKTSHELKTPLHGIVNLAQLSIDSARENDLAVVEKNNLLIKATARRMALIVNDLVDFSLIQENKFRMNIGETDILYCVHSVIEVLDYQAREKNVTFQVKVPDVARYVLVDEARFIQVIFNLVQNSLYHTRNGTITISSEHKNKQIRLSVEDTGIGIPASEHEKIFEAYEQGSRRLNNGGLGLGLAISKQLLLQMGGLLLLDWSEPGKGSKFSIFVEKAKMKDFIFDPKDVESTIETAIDYQPTKPAATILVVDDEPLNRKVLRELLTYQNYIILEAESGEQAFQILASKPLPDIVLLDVMLEDMTGYDICKKIRESYSLIEMPVLFITVNNSIRDISHAFSVGGNDYVTKPFEAEEVRARVNTLLNMKQHAKQATENEMAFLQSQIKPHFLFNTLSAVMAFTYEDPEKTRTLLQSLSIYLRTVFQTSKQTEWIPLRTELELTEAFIAIQQQRYSERLTVTLDIDENLLHYLTPPLLLQPLVENAISHGVLKRSEGGHVKIVIEEINDGILVEVQDDGVGISVEKMSTIFSQKSSGSGIGLANVQKRILRLTKQPLKIESQEHVGTTISYWIPLISSQDVNDL